MSPFPPPSLHLPPPLSTPFPLPSFHLPPPLSTPFPLPSFHLPPPLLSPFLLPLFISLHHFLPPSPSPLFISLHHYLAPSFSLSLYPSTPSYPLPTPSPSLHLPPPLLTPSPSFPLHKTVAITVPRENADSAQGCLSSTAPPARQDFGSSCPKILPNDLHRTLPALYVGVGGLRDFVDSVKDNLRNGGFTLFTTFYFIRHLVSDSKRLQKGPLVPFYSLICSLENS